MVKVLTIEKQNCEKLLGQFVDESHFDTVITEDTDLYALDQFSDENGEHNVIFKFRKNVFSDEEQRGAYDGLMPAAVPTQNRGLAAGPRAESQGQRDYISPLQEAILEAILKAPESSLDPDFDAIDNAIAVHRPGAESRGKVWLREAIKKTGIDYKAFFDTWLDGIRPLSVAERKEETKEMMKTYISDTSYANAVNSGIAGWFDRYPRIPYGRATSYTDHNPELFAKSYPYLQTLANKFEELLPQRYAKQKAFTDAMDPEFVVPGTPYTTITVNKTFRTACHRDAGDYTEGFSNITCVSRDGKKHWDGCLFVLPEFGVAVELHPGDLLLVNNHEGIHGNTQIIGDDVERISLVAYAREKMVELGSFEYETLRREYVDSRRLNKEHNLWRPLWNGISPGMWDEDEWFTYLEEHGGAEMRQQYHPKVESASLEDLF